MNKVFLSLGSNLGNKINNLDASINKIKRNKNITFISQSKIYISSPMYNLKQSDFYNMVIKVKTSLIPMQLLNVIKSIESEMGRQITLERNMPRPIDIDILSYSDSIINSKSLIIPHKKIEERNFVLFPWNDIEPDFLIPRINKKVKETLKDLISLNYNYKIRELV